MIPELDGLSLIKSGSDIFENDGNAICLKARLKSHKLEILLRKFVMRSSLA